MEYGLDEHAIGRKEIIDRLRAMPERLRAALGAGTDRADSGRAAADDWSARDVFDHIRATDAIHAPQIFLLVAAESPPLPGADERALAERAGFIDDDLETALTAFCVRRGELVRLLERLDEADWRRAGIHPAWGRTTLEGYARHMAAHEAQHLTQIERTLERL